MAVLFLMAVAVVLFVFVFDDGCGGVCVCF